MTNIPLDFDRAFFGPVGRCIYCGADNISQKLSSEHIWPYFIGGNVELEEASCATCAKETTYLDGYCAQNIFKSIRHHHGIQTRRRKNRPTHMPLIFETKSGPVKRDVPIAEQPYFMSLPQFDLPELLAGKPATPGIKADTFSMWMPTGIRSYLDKLCGPDDIGWRIPYGDYNIEVFARWLAKTALAAAVAMLGYDFMTSPLRRVVLGKYPCVGHLIGAEPRAENGIIYSEHPPNGGNDAHKIGFGYMSNERNSVLIAEMHLFSEHGNAVRYLAVIGDAMPQPVETYIKPPRTS